MSFILKTALDYGDTSIQPPVNPEIFQYAEFAKAISKCEECKQECMGCTTSTMQVNNKQERKHSSVDAKDVSQFPACKKRFIVSEVSSLDTLHDVPSEWDSGKVE